MSSYYVLPPQKEYRGIFIISTSGCGYIRYGNGGVQYKLVSVMRQQKRKIVYYLMIFERAEILYECCRSFKKIDGVPAVRVNGAFQKAPPALRPFADSRTIVLPE